MDAAGAFTYVYPAAERIFGRPAAEWIGTSAFDVIHPDDRALAQQAFMGWAQSRVHHATLANHLVHHNGTVFHMLWTINLLSSIGPEIAQTLVHIGVELHEMTAKRSLKQAIAYALAQQE